MLLNPLAVDISLCMAKQWVGIPVCDFLLGLLIWLSGHKCCALIWQSKFICREYIPLFSCQCTKLHYWSHKCLFSSIFLKIFQTLSFWRVVFEMVPPVSACHHTTKCTPKICDVFTIQSLHTKAKVSKKVFTIFVSIRQSNMARNASSFQCIKYRTFNNGCLMCVTEVNLVFRFFNWFKTRRMHRIHS